MPYQRSHAVNEMAPESLAVGWGDLWHAQPLPSAFLAATATSAARLVLFISIIAYAWAFPRNIGVANDIIALQVGFLTLLGLLSSERLPISGRLRLALLSVVIVAMGMSAHFRNHEILGALFSTFPIATLLITAFGTRITLVCMLVIHAIFGVQALDIGVQSLATIMVYISISLLWSLMVASFVTLLLARIERDFNFISELLEQERSTNKIITNELRVPAMTLSMISQHADPSPEDLSNMRDAADQMLLVIDNLRLNTAPEASRPVREEAIEITQLVRQLSGQLGPVMARMNIELITDVDRSADVVVQGDRFRLRAILSNMVRTTAAISDGYRVWLNVRAERSVAGYAGLIFDVETNGHAIDPAEFDRQLEGEAPTEDTLAEATASGLWAARFWAEQLQGKLSVFESPRGGNGFRLAISLEIDTRGLGPSLTGYVEGLEASLEGLSVLVVDGDPVSSRLVGRSLSELGLDVTDCKSIERCLERLSSVQPELLVLSAASTGMKVVEVLDGLGGEHVRTPVIVIIDDSSGVDQSELFSTGADIVLFHPLKPEDLDAAIHSLVAMGRLRRKG